MPSGCSLSADFKAATRRSSTCSSLISSARGMRRRANRVGASFSAASKFATFGPAGCQPSALELGTTRSGTPTTDAVVLRIQDDAPKTKLSARVPVGGAVDDLGLVGEGVDAGHEAA